MPDTPTELPAEAPQPKGAADGPESYTCDLCNTEVGPNRVLLLTASGQGARHDDCHTFGKAMR